MKDDRGTSALKSLDFHDLAPAGYYLALRVGFAFPMVEHNAFPATWVDQYTAGGFMLHDPVMRWVYGNRGYCRWSNLSVPDPRGILGMASDHGMAFGVAVSWTDAKSDGQRSFGNFARSDREFSNREVEVLLARVQDLHNGAVLPRNLTAAECEALRLVRDGRLLKEISAELGVSQGAIKQRLKNAKSKLGAKNSTQAATIAMQFGLI